MNSQGKLDNKKRGKDGDDGDANQSKKRFVWPDYLHREFISAVFDVGLNFVNSKEISALLPKDLSQEQIRSHVQKYRAFRRRCKTRKAISQNNSTNNLTDFNNNGSYLDSGRMGRLAAGHGTNTTTGSNNSLLEDDISIGASEDYRNIYDIDQSNDKEAENASQIQMLSNEITSVACTIAQQSSFVQSLSHGVIHQMKIYTALVDTLLQIDPAKAAEHIMSPSYLNNDLTRQPLAYLQYGSNGGRNSNNNLSHYNGVDRSTPVPSGLRMMPSQDSFNGLNSEQIIASMKTAVASPFPRRSSNDNEFNRMSHPNLNEVVDTDAMKGLGSHLSRSEFSAIFEMRAQMDLHRKLFERKEDQVGNYYLEMNQRGNNSTQFSAAVPPPPLQQPQALHHHQVLKNTNEVLFSSASGLNQAGRIPYSGESYTYNIPQPSLVNNQFQPYLVGSFNQFDMSGVQFNHSNVALNIPVSLNSDRSSGVPVSPFPSSSFYPGFEGRMTPVTDFIEHTPRLNHYNNNNNNNNTNTTASSNTNNYVTDNSNSGVVVGSGSNGANWEDNGEFEADLFSFLINTSSPERSD